MSLLPFEGLVTTILDKFFPNQTEIKRADVELKIKAIDAELQKEVQRALIQQKQIDVNSAEAANPNRKWATWRELIGYAGAAAIWYNYIIQPMIIMIGSLSGHPVNPAMLQQLNIGELLTMICGMLGLSYTPSAVNYVADRIKRPKVE